MSSTALVSGVSKQEWSRAADNAREAAASVGEMAGHAAAAVGAVAGQAASDVSQKADDLTADVGQGIQRLGDQLGRNTPHAGLVGSASQAVAKAMHDGGEYLEETKLSGLSNDIVHVIRKHPVPALLIALGLGWFAARKLGD